MLPLDISFPAACRRTLTGFIISVSSHLSHKRAADTFLDFLTNSSSVLIVFMSELSGALMTGDSQSLTTAEAIDVYLQENPESNLANMISLNQQQKKLQIVADDILQSFLEAKCYACNPLRIFLREILAGVVLEMTVQSCSKPEWINDWVIYLLEDGEPELMNVIDAGVGVVAVDKHANAIATTRSNHDSRHGIERRSIYGSCASDGVNSPHRTEEPILDVLDLNQGKAEPKGILWKEAKPTEQGSSASEHSYSDSDVPCTENVQFTRVKHSTGPSSTFTSFDQVVPSHAPTALTASLSQDKNGSSPHRTLQNASITIFDDSTPGENGNLRVNPMTDYVLQIEPGSSKQPGWMITRKYADFESLHEVLRRISVISGLVGFAEQHSTLPNWKGRTKTSLREGLEQYLCHALTYNHLAESEGMKRFLAKDQGSGNSTSGVTGNSGFGFPSSTAFESVGRGVFDVLTGAPKGAAAGGKSLLGGVTGVLGGRASRVRKDTVSMESPTGAHRAETTSPPKRHHTNGSAPRSPAKDFPRNYDGHPRSKSSGPPQPADTEDSSRLRDGSPTKRPLYLARRSTDMKTTSDDYRDSPALPIRNSTSSSETQEELHLPPPPSDIPDDYGSVTESSRVSLSSSDKSTVRSSTSIPRTSFQSTPHSVLSSVAKLPDAGLEGSPPIHRKLNAPLTEKETQVIIELLFAVINELYTLSSAWSIRRTLLNATKTYLLRPGNPNLEAIRLLLQESIIESNTSDSGLAMLIQKLVENTLPTDNERQAWPPPLSNEEREARRQKARKLLIERGMPQALTGIMGAAASSEALGRVFDCLQVERVARGLMSSLLLQAIRAATQ